MDVHLNQGLSKSLDSTRVGLKSTEWSVLVYWGISGVLGFLFLRDWILAWNVGGTWSKPWLVVLLFATLVLSQMLYAAVARHGGRALHWGASLLFAVGNGIFETFAFALVYRLGELLGRYLATLFLPAAAGGIGFATGILFFIAYGGLIHGLFWLRLLPPHLDDTPRSRAIRKCRPLAEIALVLSWSLCLWLARDIWTVVFFHMLIDLGLMVMVRPPLFNGRSSSLPKA